MFMVEEPYGISQFQAWLISLHLELCYIDAKNAVKNIFSNYICAFV